MGSRREFCNTLAVVLAAVVVWGAGWHLSTLDTAAAEMPAGAEGTPAWEAGAGQERRRSGWTPLGDPLPEGPSPARLAALSTTIP